MAAASTQYSDEKIFVDPTAASEKIAIAGEADKVSSPEKEVVAGDAPEAVTSSATKGGEEKVAVVNDQPEDTIMPTPMGLQDVLRMGASGKQHISTDDVSSPSDHPPSYASPTQASISSLFPSNQSRSYREYSYYHAAPWRPTHNTIVDPENCARYFIEVSEFSKGKHDVSFHDVRSTNAQFSAKRENLSVDEGKTCPVVAFAQYPHGTNDQVRIGVGNPEQMNTVRWIQMGRSGPTGPWSVALGTARDQERRFEWRTGRAASSDAASPVTDTPDVSSGGQPVPGTMQFVDVQRGEAIAMYTELKIGRSLKKRGKLRMYEDAVAGVSQYEKDAELLVMLSIAAINEKRRRKTWKKWALIGGG